MRAPATNKLLALTLLLAPACASNPPEPTAASARADAQEPATLDRYTPPPPVTASPVEELVELETSLAAYEAQLAHNEARLQAMGVRIARADPAGTGAERAKDSRFAEPPPPRPGDAPTAGANARPMPSSPSAPAKPQTSVRTKKTESKEKAPRADSGLGRGQQARTRDEADDNDGERGRCADLCDLAHATCDLEAKICDLASRHLDEPRYAEVCQRAGDDCRAAAEACTLCSP